MNPYVTLAKTSASPQESYVLSVCSKITGPPYPKRGMLAGLIEVVGAVFLPTPLRVVVGGIGVLRLIHGIGRFA